MTDIVERLREGCGCNFPETTCMAESECSDAFAAADEIARLRAENERLRAALEPFASIKADVGDGFSGLPDMVIIRVEASVRELKAARAALGEK